MRKIGQGRDQVGAGTDLVHDGKNGLFVPVRDVATLADRRGY